MSQAHATLDEGPASGGAPAAPADATGGAALWRWVRRNPIVASCTAFLAVLVLVVLLAPYISPYDPLDTQARLKHLAPTWAHPLGTDGYGRDVLSRILWGTRFSLAVGTVAVLVGAVFGTAVGVTAGYLRGAWDALLMSVIDILLCFPIILLAIMLVAFFGQTTQNVMLAVGIALMPRFARLARAATLAVREMNYVEAARALGISGVIINLRHILPNILSPILVALSLNIAVAILMESSLSYLGLGPPAEVITWGRITNDGRNALRQAPWVSAFGGMAITLTVLAFNILGDYVRDRLDPNFRDQG